MDEFSSKRAAGGLGSRRGCISFRDNHESKSIQCCNRQGCSTKHNSSRGTQIRSPDKLKLSKPAFLSTSRRTIFGSSCRTPCSLNVHGKSQQERRSISSMRERVTAESSRKQEKKEHFESSTRQAEMIKLHVDPASADMQTMPPENMDTESSILQGFTMNRTDASRDCQRTSSSKIQKPNSCKTESSNQGASSFVRHSVLTRNATHISKPSQNQGTNVQRQGVRNLTCTSISDVLPSGCSSSNVHQNKRMDALRKRHTDGENSAGRGKKPIGSSSRGNTDFLQNGPSGPSRVERPLAEPTSRRTRNQLTGRVGALSVRTRRPAHGDSRMRFLENGDDSTLLIPEPLMIPSTSEAQNFVDEADTASLSQSFSTYAAPICLSSSGRPGSRSGTAHSRTIGHFEDSNARDLHDPWVDRDSYQRLNMEGIEEVLLTLGRIEQAEESTYEQLMALQSNLFMGGIGFHDQHRDWRLDIDNMSYEELLALEEKMGTVSTALSEEEMSKCLRKSIYEPVTELGLTYRNNDDHDDGVDDDVKCSICQEEYIACDEIGKLHCDHRYHMACIHQWLRQKNWCPICKSSACPS